MGKRGEIHPPRVWTPEKRAEVQPLLDQNLPDPEVARLAGLTLKALQRVIEKGVLYREKKKRGRKPWKVPKVVEIPLQVEEGANSSIGAI